MYITPELLIIGASLCYGKNKVTRKEVAEYEERCPYPLEYCAEDKWEYVEYDEKEDTYTIDLKGKKLNPQMAAILTQI